MSLVLVAIVNLVCFYVVAFVFKHLLKRYISIALLVGASAACYSGYRIAANTLIRERVFAHFADSKVAVTQTQMTEYAQIVVSKSEFIWESIGGGVALAIPSILLVFVLALRMHRRRMSLQQD